MSPAERLNQAAPQSGVGLNELSSAGSFTGSD